MYNADYFKIIIYRLSRGAANVTLESQRAAFKLQSI